MHYTLQFTQMQLYQWNCHFSCHSRLSPERMPCCTCSFVARISAQGSLCSCHNTLFKLLQICNLSIRLVMYNKILRICFFCILVSAQASRGNNKIERNNLTVKKSWSSAILHKNFTSDMNSKIFPRDACMKSLQMQINCRGKLGELQMKALKPYWKVYKQNLPFQWDSV